MQPELPNPPSDAEFVGLLTQSQLSLLLYVRSLLPGEADASDVAQQANAKIWEKRADFALGTNFLAWSFAIARFEVLNYRKRQARDSRLTFSEDLEQTIASELQQIDDDLLSRQEALRKCLDGLKPEARTLLMDRYETTESLADFARRIGRSAGGLKVSLHRIRATLADCIERRLATGAAR
ncbi:RNA polymerase sigma factor [Rosistilla carotiformis]|uniref:RNA polymerase sigma factor n=1 Tax=Rosistilla carotiformis TaxID=2528017 RepID=A0A518JM69_9BACT|nr:sigma-70 family RNA polymerase sigma factor [Rosistilla carotiformis]QDV66645.1 RNA polymerase sigma factor [Rosistilla carotiformis]